MQHDRLIGRVLLAGALLISLRAAPCVAETTQWLLHGGRTVLQVDSTSLAALDVSISARQAVEIATQDTLLAYSMDPDRAPLLVIRDGGEPDVRFLYLPHDGRLSVDANGRLAELDGWVIRWAATETGGGLVIAPPHADVSDEWLELRDAKVTFDRESQILLIESGEVVVARALANELDAAELLGQSIGTLTAEIVLLPSGANPPGAENVDARYRYEGEIAGTNGPDVIVGTVYQLTSWGSVGDIAAFSAGTVSCNQGDTPLSWVSGTNQHPVIAQNMFRLKNGRFEQIGQSWLKHGFLALTGNACGLGCQDPNTGALLGVGCSDPYSASLNGAQYNLGPKYEVNAHTGAFPYPPDRSASFPQTIGRRLQVHHSDLDTAQQGGGSYFIEAQYVTPDDAAWGNQNNNASYRPITVSRNGSSFSASLSGSTQRRDPGIRAWQDTDPTVEETTVQIPSEGRMILASKATDLGGGLWHYEYALQNLNSDRSAGSFRVSIPTGASVLNTGFHDVDYHSGEPFDGTEWTTSLGGGELSWSTTPYVSDPDANALRWGTLYNFRFDSDAPPGAVTVTVGLFKPGSPGSVGAAAVGPAGPPPVCGDSLVEGAEECDPPDALHCDDDCRWICGDGVVQSGEECDPPDALHCDNGCQWICGDGVVQSGEACDDGGESTECDVDCTTAICGDGHQNPSAGEACDAGGESATCDADCTAVVCGDGVTNDRAGEECDPPNGTTCNGSCRRIATCGDGVLDPNEDCDPPGTVSCDNACRWISRVNDACADATILCPGTHTGSTVGATADGAASCGSSNGGRDVWYTYRPGGDGTAVVSTCGSFYDSVLSVYDAGCPGDEENEIACDDDGCGSQSLVTWEATGGVTYLIRVAGYLGLSGSFTLTLTGPDCECQNDVDCPDPDDVCTDPTCDRTACVAVNTTGPCDDGNNCTTDDACVDGACVGGPLARCDDPPFCTDCNRNGARDLCEGLPDCNGNGLPDECEFADCNGNGVNDVCEIADHLVDDCDGGPVGDADEGAVLFGSKCFACHGPDGSGGAGPDLRDQPRTALWRKLLPPSTHSGGVHPEYSDEDFADLEAFLASAGGGARPDRVPDECQALTDCDDDGVADGCELGGGTQLDEDRDGVPDRCACLTALAPAPDPTGMEKNRYLSIVPDSTGVETALRVMLTSLHHPDPPNAPCCPAPDFGVFEGSVRWVGPPLEFDDAYDPPSRFIASALQCTPYFADWNGIDVLYVYGAAVVPSSAYTVQAIDATCVEYLTDETAYSAALTVTTARWGDIVAPFAVDGGATQPDFIDIAAVVDKFADGAGAPTKARAELVGDTVDPDKPVDFQDIAAVVDAFQSLAYPYAGPEACP